MYSFEVSQLSIAFEITPDDLRAIEDRDNDLADEAAERDAPYDYNSICLSGMLDKIEGVSDADYNGHFGPYIFFNLDTEDDSPAKRVEILTLILDYINGTGDFA